MSFFQSFSALGYSAINLVLLSLVILVVVWRGLGFHKRHWIFSAVLVLIFCVGFVFATHFLADQNRMLNEAIRDEGGLKRDFPKNEP